MTGCDFQILYEIMCVWTPFNSIQNNQMKTDLYKPTCILLKDELGAQQNIHEYLRIQRRLRSSGAPVPPEHSLLPAGRIFMSLAVHRASSKYSDQTVQIRRLICVIVGHSLCRVCCTPAQMSHVMRLWYFSSPVNSFFKRTIAAIPWGLDV